MNDLEGACEDCGAPVVFRATGVPKLEGVAFGPDSRNGELVYHDQSACVRHLAAELRTLRRELGRSKGRS